MKKAIAVALALVAVLALAGCEKVEDMPPIDTVTPVAPSHRPGTSCIPGDLDSVLVCAEASDGRYRWLDR